MRTNDVTGKYLYQYSVGISVAQQAPPSQRSSAIAAREFSHGIASSENLAMNGIVSTVERLLYLLLYMPKGKQQACENVEMPPRRQVFF